MFSWVILSGLITNSPVFTKRFKPAPKNAARVTVKWANDAKGYPKKGTYSSMPGEGDPLTKKPILPGQ